jgi:hypothetical protein
VSNFILQEITSFIFNKTEENIILRTTAHFILIFPWAACTQTQIRGTANCIVRAQRADINISLLPCQCVTHTKINKYEKTIPLLLPYEIQTVSELNLDACLRYLVHVTWSSRSSTTTGIWITFVLHTVHVSTECSCRAVSNPALNSIAFGTDFPHSG